MYRFLLFLLLFSHQIITVAQTHSPPYNFTAWAVSHDDIILYWEDSITNIQFYVVERTIQGETNYQEIWKNTRNYRMFQDDDGLQPETVYSYRLYSIISNRKSAYVYDTARTLAVPPPPNAPDSLVSPNITSYSVTLNWRDNSDNEIRFHLERSENDTLNFNEIKILYTNDIEYIDTSVVEKTNYYYRIRVSFDNIYSSYSDILHVQTKYAQFKELPFEFPDTRDSRIKYIDFDDDGDLDILFNGYIGGYYNTNKKLGVFLNEGNDFRFIDGVHSGLTNGTLDIGDFNNDNEPDYFIIGTIEGATKQTGLFSKINGESIQDISFMLGHIYNHYFGQASFQDLDQNGWQDIIYSGEYANAKLNYGDTVETEVFLTEPKYDNVFVTPFDLDKDGLLEFLVTPIQYYIGDRSQDSVYHVHLGDYENRTNLLPNESGLRTFSTGDYDGDGDEDIVIRYLIESTKRVSRVFKNNSGQLDFVVDLPDAQSYNWFDFDNDGDLDILLQGGYQKWAEFENRLFINEGNDQFVDSQIIDIVGTDDGVNITGDYDNDGDMDVLATNTSSQGSFMKLFVNMHVEETGINNKAPSIPQDLNSVVSGNNVVFNWSPSADNESPPQSISYNLYVLKGADTLIVSPLSNLESGFRKITKKGNAGTLTSYSLNCLKNGVYTWAVQAIDNNNNASEFSDNGTFDISSSIPLAPAKLSAIAITEKRIDLSWEDESQGGTEYLILRKLSSKSSSYFNIATLSQNTSYFVDTFNLEPNTSYSYKVISRNCAYRKGFYSTASAKTFPDHFIIDPGFLLDETEGYDANFGDYDNDGDLDILISYNNDDSYQLQTKIFKNESGTFTDSKIEFDSHSLVSFVDINKDGYLDVVANNYLVYEFSLTFYKNNGDGSFSKSDISKIELGTVGHYRPAWADFDNDGDLDCILYGKYDVFDAPYTIKIVENIGGDSLEIKDLPFEGIIKSRNPWGDFNNDGYLDIAATEVDGEVSRLVIYQNDGNKNFFKADIGSLQGLNNDCLNNAGEMAWGDYNCDGFLDLLIVGQHTGYTGDGIVLLFKNNQGKSFTRIKIDGKKYISKIFTNWGDYDNDGDLDILLYGEASWENRSSGRTRIYENKGNDKFTEMPYDYFDSYWWEGNLSTCDYDNDGDLDILHLGEKYYTQPRVLLYKNTFSEYRNIKNSPPYPPDGLTVENLKDYIKFSWQPAEDDLSSSLSYNVILKNETDTIIIPNALSNGFRTVVGLGNAGLNHFMIVKNLKKGTYTWAVQAIDNIYRGSAFSKEDTFVLEKDKIEITGLEKVEFKNQISLFPNPAFEYLNIEGLEWNKIYDCEIINSVGIRNYLETSMSTTDGRLQLNIKNLKNGMYIIVISCNNQEMSYKFVKNEK
jgi:hypothetical protein